MTSELLVCRAEEKWNITCDIGCRPSCSIVFCLSDRDVVGDQNTQ